MSKGSNMSIKGKQREQKEFAKKFYVGFTTVKVVAVNPSREEINKLVGKEDSPDDKEMVYLGEDQEGNERLRLAFWLKDVKTGELYPYSFNLTNKERRNKDNTKVQIINSTCGTTWVPVDENGKVDESAIPNWFTTFTDRENQVLGTKKWRKALAGEEELGTLLRSWLGKLNFMDADTEVLVDTKKLFKENYKELRELITLDEKDEFTGEGYDTPFVALLGVRTDEADSTKKYQQVWGKGFLSESFMKYINNGGENGPKFSSEYTKKVWKKFKDEVTGDYGFDGYTELVALKEYDESKDISGGLKTGKEVPAPTSSDY